MIVLLWHGSGWDDLLLMGGAILVALIIVKLAVRGDGESDDAPEP